MATVYYVSWRSMDEGVPEYNAAASLHLSPADANAFLADMRAKEQAEAARNGERPGYVPGFYLMIDSTPRPVSVDDATYAAVAASKNGIWAKHQTSETFSAR